MKKNDIFKKFEIILSSTIISDSSTALNIADVVEDSDIELMAQYNPNNEYTWTEVCEDFNINPSGGAAIQRGKHLGKDVLVIYMKLDDNRFENEYKKSAFTFGGSGQKGDQKINTGPNKLLVDAINNKKIPIHLFFTTPVFAKKYVPYFYVGEVDADLPERFVKDNQDQRVIYKFRLMPKDMTGVESMLEAINAGKEIEARMKKRKTADSEWNKHKKRLAKENKEIQKNMDSEYNARNRSTKSKYKW